MEDITLECERTKTKGHLWIQTTKISKERYYKLVIA